MQNLTRTVRMFALACLSAIIVGPLAAGIGVMQLNEFPGSFTAEVVAPGEQIKTSKPGRTFTIWGTGSELDRASVTCTNRDRELTLAPRTEETQVDGRTFVVLLDGRYNVLDELRCTGGGLEEIRVSARTPEDRAWAFVVGGAVATVVLFPLGLVLWRRTGPATEASATT